MHFFFSRLHVYFNTFYSLPLRWFFGILYFGLVLISFIIDPVQKYHAQRLLELGLGIAILLWSSRACWDHIRENRPLVGWPYGFGLLGLFLVSLIGASLGSIPWVSLGFSGVLLLELALMPLVALAWHEHRADALRVLALFSFCLIGTDLGFWVIARIHGWAPYLAVWHFSPVTSLAFSPPYLFHNPRWANQLTVLLLWSYLPLLHQLLSLQIRRYQLFWWSICLGVPSFCWIQIVLSNGDGAFISSLMATLVAAFVWFRSVGYQRFLWGRALSIALVALFFALLCSALLDSTGLLADFVARNAAEFNGVSPQSDRRLISWPLYLAASLRSPLWGTGIQVVPFGSSVCGPHNIWISLLYWTGFLGVFFSLFFFRAFSLSSSPFGLPMGVALFFYQLVDDVWLRPVSLSVLLLLLSLFMPLESDRIPHNALRYGWLHSFGMNLFRVRSLALCGLALILISVLQPGGVGLGPSPLVSRGSGSLCLLLF